MICYDAESEELVQETLSANPIVVFNPIHISTGVSAITTGVNVGKARRSQWRIACDSIGRRFEWLAATSGCAFVRCDQVRVEQRDSDPPPNRRRLTQLPNHPTAPPPHRPTDPPTHRPAAPPTRRPTDPPLHRPTAPNLLPPSPPTLTNATAAPPAVSSGFRLVPDHHA